MIKQNTLPGSNKKATKEKNQCRQITNYTVNALEERPILHLKALEVFLLNKQINNKHNN